MRGVRHLVCEGCGGCRSEQKWSLHLVKKGLKVKKQPFGSLVPEGE